MSFERIAVVGAGAWGSALANVIARVRSAIQPIGSDTSATASATSGRT